MVDHRPALLAFAPDEEGRKPLHFVILEWAHEHVVSTRDFRYARYAQEGADVRMIERLD